MERLDITLLDERYRDLRVITPVAMGALRESVERHGVLQPLLVNQLEDGTCVLLDGFKRLDLLREQDEQQAMVSGSTHLHR